LYADCAPARRRRKTQLFGSVGGEADAGALVAGFGNGVWSLRGAILIELSVSAALGCLVGVRGCTRGWAGVDGACCCACRNASGCGAV